MRFAGPCHLVPRRRPRNALPQRLCLPRIQYRCSNPAGVTSDAVRRTAPLQPFRTRGWSLKPVRSEAEPRNEAKKALVTFVTRACSVL